MTVIPGTHYTLGETLVDDLPHFVVTCARATCEEQFVSPAILWCEAQMETHWETTHKDLL